MEEAEALIRQDLAPFMERMFKQTFPSFAKIAKTPASGAVHTWTPSINIVDRGDWPFGTVLVHYEGLVVHHAMVIGAFGRAVMLRASHGTQHHDVFFPRSSEWHPVVDRDSMGTPK